MKSNYKPKNKQKGKTPTLRIQTDVRAGWVPGQNVRNAISSWRSSLPSDVWAPEVR